MIKVIFTSFLAFVFFLIEHILSFYYLNPFEKVQDILFSWKIGILICIFIYIILPDEEKLNKIFYINKKIIKEILSIFITIIIYSLLFVGYLEFYFTADRSITFRILILTSEQKMGFLTEEYLLKNYDKNLILTRRLDDLVYGGYLIKEDDKYKLTEKGKIITGIYSLAINTLHLNQTDYLIKQK